MNKRSAIKSSMYLVLGIFLTGMLAFEPRLNAGSGTVAFLNGASAQTSNCLTVYNQLSTESTVVGKGNYPLVNEKTSLATAWGKLKAASDATFNASNSTISDGSKNIYVNYYPASAEQYEGKTIVGSINISGGPAATKKVRFTKP
jgi:hypothetical protein